MAMKSHASLTILISALLLLFIGCDSAKESQESSKIELTPPEPLPKFERRYWPSSGWKTKTPEETGVKSEGLQKAAEFAFQRSGNETDRKGFRSDGMVVIKDGYLIFEKYARGYKKDTPHLLWSVAKSFTNAMAGIAVRDGHIQLESEAHTFYPALGETTWGKELRVKHLMQMSSGLDAEEGYEYLPYKSTVISMLYTRGRNDMAEYTSHLPMRAKPGTYLYYSSCDTNLLSGILKKSMPLEKYENLPWKELFHPLGIQTASWERDRSGTFVGSSYVYMSPRDLAKFGFLYLNNGVWNGKRILPEGWVDFTRTPAEAFKTTPEDPWFNVRTYAGMWYINTGIPQRGFPVSWPAAPRDMFAASGHWGKNLFVIPSLDLIVVRLGDERKDHFDNNEFLRLVVESVKK